MYFNKFLHNWSFCWWYGHKQHELLIWRHWPYKIEHRVYKANALWGLQRREEDEEELKRRPKIIVVPKTDFRSDVEKVYSPTRLEDIKWKGILNR